PHESVHQQHILYHGLPAETLINHRYAPRVAPAKKTSDQQNLALAHERVEPKTSYSCQTANVEYQLTAELTPPVHAPELDPLQQVGVLSLLDNRLNSLLSVEGPDGTEILPIEHSLHAHLGGTVVHWLLEAPALVLAEDATRAVLEQILEEVELLQDWEVKHCAVTATDDQLESAMAAVPD